MNDEELQEKLEEILMYVCHTGSMTQAGKTINPNMFSEKAEEIRKLYATRDQQIALAAQIEEIERALKPSHRGGLNATE